MTYLHGAALFLAICLFVPSLLTLFARDAGGKRDEK